MLLLNDGKPCGRHRRDCFNWRLCPSYFEKYISVLTGVSKRNVTSKNLYSKVLVFQSCQL